MKAAGVLRKAAVLFLVLAGVPSAFADKSFFRSNGAGLLLQKIQPYRRDEFGFVVEVEKTAGREVRRLFEKGRETRRWEISFDSNGVKREERELEGGRMSARRVYAASGDQLLEETYRGGRLQRRAAYDYKNGELSSIRVTGADGKPLYTDRFLLSVRGSLRTVRRTYNDGSDPVSSHAAEGNAEERDSIGGISYVTRYDGLARVKSRDKWKNGKLLWREELAYRGDGDTPSSSTEKSFEDGRRADRSYDEKGRLVVEVESASGKQTARTEYSWDADGHNTAKSRRGEEGLEEWLYTYGADGTLLKEEYLRRGSPEKTTLHTSKDERVEELYENGRIVLKVYYKGDVKTKEEVVEAGKVVSERSVE